MCKMVRGKCAAFAFRYCPVCESMLKGNCGKTECKKSGRDSARLIYREREGFESY